MLLIRAFPLSFAIFWRFLMVLPLWFIFYAVLSFGTLYVMMFLVALAMSIPFIGVILGALLSLAGVVVVYLIAMHPYLLAIGFGLRKLGIPTQASQKQIFGAAVGYGIAEAILGYIVVFVFAVIGIALAQNGLSFMWALNASTITDPVGNLATQLATGNIGVISVLTALAVMTIRAAFLPVLADAASGRSPSGHGHSAFSGFGADLPKMMLVLLTITGLTAALQLLPVLRAGAGVVGLIDLLTGQMQNLIRIGFAGREISVEAAEIAAIGVLVLAVIWLFCLQCAGAALSYQSRTAHLAAKKKARIVEQAAATPDIGDLLRARMPSKSR